MKNTHTHYYNFYSIRPGIIIVLFPILKPGGEKKQDKPLTIHMIEQYSGNYSNVIRLSLGKLLVNLAQVVERTITPLIP